MTDGILLNEIHRDRELRRYDTIIIDEAHERSLNIDFLLGYLKRLLPRRPDLKVIVTSATIDPESFARHFADASGEPAPVIEVSGRTYPVEIRYRPLVAESGAGGDGEDSDDEGAAADDKDVQQGILDALDELERESSGDVLVFLSGESEIRDAEAAVRAHATRRGGAGETEVLPLYGRLSSADQHRVFEPSKVAGLRRRVVLATNVAETSLTVPGIRYVVDAGTARISRYSRAVEGAAAADRGDLAGVGEPALGALGPHERRHRDPPLLARTTSSAGPSSPTPRSCARTSPPSSCRWRRSGSATIEEFPFLTPPDSRGIRDGLDLLRELGALDDGAAWRRPAAHARRPPAVAAADRAAVRAHGARVEGAGRLPRGARDRRGAHHPGPARAPAREARAGRRVPRPLRRPDERLPHRC